MIIDRNSPIPQYFQLQTWLKEQIELGVFRTGDKIPTEEELVQITGLARDTIRQAIGNLVNMGHLIRRRRLGTFVTQPAASSNFKNIVGVLVPDIRSGYTPELARGAEDEAAKNKLSIIICNTDDLYVKADYHADRLIDNAVCSVIFVPTAISDEKNRMIVEKFHKKNIPVVLADRTIPDIELDFVTTDNYEGAYQLTQYLISKGHKRIGITLSTLFSTERQRLEGYKKALTDNDIAIDDELIRLNSGPYNENYYMQVAKDFLTQKNRPTAIFAGHDRIAYQVLKVAHKLEIEIPRDISLVGYDDLHTSSSNSIPLTTMHQPIYEMGQQSLKILLGRLNNSISTLQQVTLKSYLVERSSVAEIK